MNLSIPLIRRLANDESPDSLANRFRSRRFRQFKALVESMPKPLRIIDVGGTNEFWERRGWAGLPGVEITTVNRVSERQIYENIKPVTADATDLSQFPDRGFDVAFSNSVIEHLFTFENQRLMASEIQRVGKAFWVQTPNYWFPIEPHFHVPGWQWMPLNVRVSLIQRRRCGWRGPCPDSAGARELVEEVRLLTKHELKDLFPAATLVPERFCGAIKSWTAMAGFASHWKR
jgi:hypothetical protein